MARNTKSLRDRAKEFSTLLPFMEGRDKGDMEDILDKTLTIDEYGYLQDTDEDGNEKDYAVFTVKEDPKAFYFGGKVLTDNLKELDADGYHEAVNKEGLPVRFTSKKSKNKRNYTAVQFYPEA